MPTLTVPGAELRYESAGRASAPALLLIPAGIATLRMWDEQIDALAEDHFVARYDPRGFGGSRHDESVPFANHADAIAVLDHLGIAEATVIGASRGGRIALDTALASPGRVRGVVTVGSEPGGSPDLPLTDEEQRRFDEVEAIDPAVDAALLMRLEAAVWAVGPLRSEAELDPGFVRRAYELNAPNAAHATDDGTMLPLEPPAYERLGDLRMPALVTVGEYDVSPVLAAYDHLLERLPNATGVRFADTAHLPSVERPEEFARVLLDWLGEHGF
ncbi:alpha/beta fold hydrolase [Agromyces cerinus]|uniref:Pimeloyl-ACP methyl ester carboxylesterase n=1 Tax=Agromyces cerinus subsp. cerinus TaxID=232089 RepID=A0A1N6ENF7_9MICO|nr:alpha/beta fold hydrolase [Agromyces cerinus]SIN84566.1 Pimeloyl-ACP methyl ester carboxylesterase [Agromyces cerinus subsp. cerinus]